MSRLYDRRAWRRASRAFLQANPLCRMCQEVGKTRLAELVDHIEPHRGDPELFWDQDNWAASCKPCHDGAKQELEKSGTIRGCDINGRPLDPNHPWNQEG